MKQKRHTQLKTLAARIKTLQDEMERTKDRPEKDNEVNKKMSVMTQKVKEEDIKKTQENQQVLKSIPRLVKVELKEARVHQKAQEDETQTLKQAEENESTDSEILMGCILAGFLGLCEGIGSYHSSDRKGSRFNKYLKDDRKPERVNLIIKR